MKNLLNTREKRTKVGVPFRRFRRGQLHVFRNVVGVVLKSKKLRISSTPSRSRDLRKFQISKISSHPIGCNKSTNEHVRFIFVSPSFFINRTAMWINKTVIRGENFSKILKFLCLASTSTMPPMIINTFSPILTASRHKISNSRSSSGSRMMGLTRIAFSQK